MLRLVLIAAITASLTICFELKYVLFSSVVRITLMRFKMFLPSLAMALDKPHHITRNSQELSMTYNRPILSGRVDAIENVLPSLSLFFLYNQ
jgi:hypothetical protein